MVTSPTQGLSRQSEFEQFFREALAIMLNIQCLEGIMKPLSEGDTEYLRPMIGDFVLLRKEEGLPASIDLCWQIMHGISILKPLAAELFLKALISDRKHPDEIHDLEKLFDELKMREQSELDGLFAKHFGIDANPRVPHIQLPNFRSVMQRHKGDFVGVRYGEAVPEYLARTADGMSNLTAATEALREACLTHPRAAAWMKSPPQRLGDTL